MFRAAYPCARSPNTSEPRAGVRLHGQPNTSGLVACEQPEAEANSRPSTQTVYFPPSVPASSTTRSCPFQGSLRSFVPRLSYLSNTSPPALPRPTLLPFLFCLSSFTLYPTTDSPFLYRAVLLFSSLHNPIRAGSLNPPVMARCIFLRRS